MELSVIDHSNFVWSTGHNRLLILRVPYEFNVRNDSAEKLFRLGKACENAAPCSATSLALGFLVMKREPTKEELSKLTKIFKEEGET